MKDGHTVGEGLALISQIEKSGKAVQVEGTVLQSLGQQKQTVF